MYIKTNKDLWKRIEILTVFVGTAGFEPATSSSQNWRDNRTTLRSEGRISQILTKIHIFKFS